MKTDRFIGLPWVQYGADWSGVDCWGLVTLFYREEMGIAIPQSGRGNGFAEVVLPREKDVVMFVGHEGWHAGIFTDYGLLHVREGQLSKISPMKTFRHMRLQQFFRWAK